MTEQREKIARKYSEIRALWHKHGGYQSGPRVEHVSMPEARFDGFLSDFLALLSAPQDRDVGDREDILHKVAEIRDEYRVARMRVVGQFEKGGDL